jgi:hypothetical protein
MRLRCFFVVHEGVFMQVQSDYVSEKFYSGCLLRVRVPMGLPASRIIHTWICRDVTLQVPRPMGQVTHRYSHRYTHGLPMLTRTRDQPYHSQALPHMYHLRGGYVVGDNDSCVVVIILPVSFFLIVSPSRLGDLS